MRKRRALQETMNIFHLLLPPAFGFVIGFVTNALAIRMLFRPYEKMRILGVPFHGMVPRRKADIARTVSRVVVSELLKGESVAQRLAGQDVRKAFEGLILHLARRYLDEEYGTLGALMGQEECEGVEQAVTHLVLEASRVAQEQIATPEGERVIEATLASLLERSAAELFRGEEVLASRIAVGKVMEALTAPDLEEQIRRILARFLVDLAGTGRSLGSIVPGEAKAALRGAVATALPTLLRRFEEALLSPQNVERIKAAVRSGIESYLLETEGGFVKNLVRQAAMLGRERIFAESDQIVDANLHRLGELVYEAENRARMESAIEEALDVFLGRTVAEVFESLPTETLDLLYTRAAHWCCGRLLRPEVTEALARLLEREAGRLFDMPLRELFQVSGVQEGAPRRWARQLARWGSEGGIESIARREAPLLARVVLTTPIGRPSRFLPGRLLQDFAALAVEQLMPVVSAKVPEILGILDVQALIEREILSFSPQEVERVILSVARRELRAITWWGGALGAMVGGVQAAMTWLGR